MHLPSHGDVGLSMMGVAVGTYSTGNVPGSTNYGECPRLAGPPLVILPGLLGTPVYVFPIQNGSAGNRPASTPDPSCQPSS